MMLSNFKILPMVCIALIYSVWLDGMHYLAPAAAGLLLIIFYRIVRKDHFHITPDTVIDKLQDLALIILAYHLFRSAAINSSYAFLYYSTSLVLQAYLVYTAGRFIIADQILRKKSPLQAL